MGLRYESPGSRVLGVIACVVMALAVWELPELCVVVFGIETKIAQLLQVAVAVVVGVVVYIILLAGCGWRNSLWSKYDQNQEYSSARLTNKTKIFRRDFALSNCGVW